MTCYNPLACWRNPNGSGRVIFSPSAFEKNWIPMHVPCGQCIGCRLEHSRQWAIRCEHEAKMWPRNCFITLTYSNEYLPAGSTLVRRDVTLFLKRLRKRFGSGIRYYGCGEYGEKFARPHYHLVLFNHDFDDRKLFKMSGKFGLYVSAELQKLWPYGHSVVADFSFEVAAYVSRYVTKKINGAQKEAHYGDRSPEFSCMSRRGGIGESYFYKYYDDIVNYDEVVTRAGRVCQPPRYYDKLLSGCDLELFEKNKQKRVDKFLKSGTVNEHGRLERREQAAILRFKRFMRSYENG